METTATVEVLVGMIASGKSTYARSRADAGALVVCHDDLTAMLHKEYRYEQGLRECYRRMEESIAWAALNAGRDVVVDRTHLTRESRHRWVRWARNYNSLQTFDGRGPRTRVVAVFFPVGDPRYHAELRTRDDPRGRTFEDWLMVATHHYEQWVKEPLLDGDHEGFDEVVKTAAPPGFNFPVARPFLTRRP